MGLLPFHKRYILGDKRLVGTTATTDNIHKTFIDKFNEEHKYAMIIATQGDLLPSPVAYGDPDLDITDALLAGLNSEYVNNKGKETEDTATTTKE